MKTLILLTIGATIGVVIMSLFSVNAWDDGFEAGVDWQQNQEKEARRDG